MNADNYFCLFGLGLDSQGMNTTFKLMFENMVYRAMDIDAFHAFKSFCSNFDTKMGLARTIKGTSVIMLVACMKVAFVNNFNRRWRKGSL